ncbi:MAG: MBL fold metallo-hydrolase [Firmicutes bacterium]|nr:MBL fold metallo-hydrolase [Bacillota bacterium]
MKKLWILICLLAMMILGGCSGDGTVSDGADVIYGDVAEDAAFSIYFFDVGQADAALVICDGETMLIDGGNVADGDDVVASIDALGVSELDVVVSTHTDEDHLGGLPDVMESFEVGALYADGNPADTKIYQRFCDVAADNGLDMTDPEPGDTFALGSADVTFLGPIRLASDPNANSIVLRIDYGATSYIFTGDATEKEEKEIVEAGMELSANVLKVSHHGAEESSSYVFLREVMPDYAVISVGAGNKYGHPTEATLSRLRDVGAAVYRTDELGMIICRSDGVNIAFSNSNQSAMPPAEENRTDKVPAVEEDAAYIGNSNSKKFHLPDCGSLPEEQNSVYFATKEEALSQGYEPCGRCKP